MKRFVSLILSVCFLFSINTVSYAANISSRKASNPVIQSMNDKYHVDFSGMSIDELNKFIDKMKDEDQTRASGNLLNNTQLAWLAAAQIARDKGYECAALMVESNYLKGNLQLSYLKEGESILVISNGKVLLSDPYQFDKIYSIQLLQ